MTKITKNYDLVVVGGGLSGVCAAISAARHGVKTALVQNRTVLGGNASSEFRMNINGATQGIAKDGGKEKVIESGIILELLMANRYQNPQISYHVFDNVLWENTKFQENLDLYLNCSIHEVKTENNRIVNVVGIQQNTEIEYTFVADYFTDTTGDATVAYLSGADYTIGREGKKVYNEHLAPDETDIHTMGNSMLFTTKDMGKPVPFKRPKWAYEFTKEMRASRKIVEFNYGYWWIELGGDEFSTITDAEQLKDELTKYVYGVFDYIKNSGEFPKEEVEGLAIDWISTVSGKRESRRVYGDYVLNENDINEAKRFDDAVAYGGWTMDDHTIGGLRAKVGGKDEKGTVWNPLKDIYTIPYRCLYSRNIENLYVGGRCISASHMAMSSTRVMATCAVIGQAIGTASSIAVREKITPREVMKYIKELQQTLIKDDCYIPGIKVDDKDDVVTNLDCTITSSSNIEGGEPTNINGDWARRVGNDENAWISDEISENGEWIKIDFPRNVKVKDMILRFDPCFTKEIYPSTRHWVVAQYPDTMPYQLVKDYSLIFMNNGEEVKKVDVDENFQRVNKHTFDDTVECNSVKLLVKSNYGDKYARVNDIRIYE